MKSLSVLVADDEPSIRDLVQLWLTEAGHRPIGVANATEAARVMAKERFDLVITDVLMPDGDGLQLIAKFKAAQPAARILAISGGGRYMEGDDCLKLARGLGADAAVIKPFKRPDLLAGVAAALAPEARPEKPRGK